MARGKHNLSYLGLAVLGGVVGVTLGLLLAPAPGRLTRRRLSEGASNVVDKGQDAVEGVAEYLQEAVSEGRRTFSRVVNG